MTAKNYNETRIGVILLAAGASARMNGRPKQLLEFAGRTLLRRAAETVLNANCERIVVVLGANAELTAKEIVGLPLEIVVNENWAAGIGESIKTGASVLVKDNLTAIVVMLGDQPFVTAETVRGLIEKYEQTAAPIVASFYNETTGVPALFAREMFHELTALSGDAGAKFVIKKHRARTVTIAAPEAAFDVDTIADYERLQAKSPPTEKLPPD